MDREKLIEEALSFGISEPQTKSPEVLKREIHSANQAVIAMRGERKPYLDMDADTFRGELEKFDIEFDESDLKNRNIVIQDLIVRKKINAIISASSSSRLPVLEKDQELDVETNMHHLKKLKESYSESLPDAEKRELKNYITSAENAIRRAYGIVEKGFIQPSDQDLRNLLYLDDGILGWHCTKYMEGIESLGDRGRISDRLIDLILMNKMDTERAESEANFLFQMEGTYDDLKTVPPETTKDKDKIVLNPEFLDWRFNLIDFKHLLYTKSKAIESMKHKPSYTVRFNSIYGLVQDLFNKYCK